MERIPEADKKTKELKLPPEKLAQMIDHTQLSPYKPKSDLKKLCDEAKAYNFYSVCVNPYWTTFCENELKGTDIEIAVVVGFPLGANTSKLKALETKEAVENGATEIDMVMNVGAFRDKNHDFVKEDIKAVLDAAAGNPLKVIIESGYLTYEQITEASKLVKEAGAQFVKNSTGFGPMGATIPHVYMMREAVGNGFGVKASGSINDFRDALRMAAAGATRLGTSAGVKIMDSYTWARLTDWDIEEIPCRLCPSRKANFDKMPKGVFQYYKMKCVTCPFREYNRFYE